MNCSFCGYQLPQGGAVCPNCGAATSPYISNSGIPGGTSPYDPTYISAPPYIPQPPPTTSYGSDPYSTLSSPQQHTTSPYNTPLQVPYASPPPPTPKQNQGMRIALIVGTVLLVLLFIGGGLLFFGLRNLTNSTTANTATQNPYAPKTGTLVLNDPMTDNSKGYKWDESTSSPTNNANDIATCGFSGGTYHISETQKGGFLCDPEAPGLVFSDLAFEVKLIILKGDNAGVIIREDQSKVTGYMFFIDTQGDYTLQTSDASNTSNNKTLRSGKNAAIKQGLSQMNLIALVVNGTTISAYVNNTLIDSVQDSTFSEGQFGIYGASNNGAYDVTASDARVWRVGNALPTPTASQNPYPPKTGTVAIDDPLHDNSKGYGWDEFTDNSNPKNTSICAFTGGVYHFSRTQSGSIFCTAKAQDLVFSNLAFEAKLTLIKGSNVGLIIRYDPNKLTGYLFLVGSESDYHLYSFNFKNPDPNKQFTLLRSGTNTAIKRGFNQTNLVAIVSNNSTIGLYVNNQFIDGIQDTTYTSGQIGVYVEGNSNEEGTASDARVWRI